MQVWVSSPDSYEDREGALDSKGKSHLRRASSPIRVLLALDNEQDGECLLTHVKLLARTGVVTARVLHVVEQATVVGFSTIETTQEAQALVDGAIFSLEMSGIDASGALRFARIDRIGIVILGEALGWCAERRSERSTDLGSANGAQSGSERASATAFAGSGSSRVHTASWHRREEADVMFSCFSRRCES